MEGLGELAGAASAAGAWASAFSLPFSRCTSGYSPTRCFSQEQTSATAEAKNRRRFANGEPIRAGTVTVAEPLVQEVKSEPPRGQSSASLRWTCGVIFRSFAASNL